jgi:hypothetical protein
MASTPPSFTINTPAALEPPSRPSSSPRERFLALVDQAARALEADMRAPSLYQQGREDERRRLDTLLAARLDVFPCSARVVRAELQTIRAMLNAQT